jgi:hypothetical protein
MYLYVTVMMERGWIGTEIGSDRGPGTRRRSVAVPSAAPSRQGCIRGRLPIKHSMTPYGRLPLFI